MQPGKALRIDAVLTVNKVTLKYTADAKNRLGATVRVEGEYRGTTAVSYKVQQFDVVPEAL